MTPSSMAAIFAVGLVLLVVGFLVVTSYNAVMALIQRIDKAWANIDVALKQRHDQLPALVSAVRGALAFEHDVLADVTEARAAYSPAEPIPAPSAAGSYAGQTASSDEYCPGGTVRVHRSRGGDSTKIAFVNGKNSFCSRPRLT